jgi:hypothetical protein
MRQFTLYERQLTLYGGEAVTAVTDDADGDAAVIMQARAAPQQRAACADTAGCWSRH